jgi:hypothetical protein
MALALLQAELATDLERLVVWLRLLVRCCMGCYWLVKRFRVPLIDVVRC